VQGVWSRNPHGKDEIPTQIDAFEMRWRDLSYGDIVSHMMPWQRIVCTHAQTRERLLARKVGICTVSQPHEGIGK
jgi:hypothetical protein